MNGFAGLFQKKSVFWYGYLLFFVGGNVFLMSYGKADSFLALNSYHTNGLDVFFIGFTNLGDGLFAILLAALFYLKFKKRKIAFDLLLVFLLSGLIAQIVKHAVHSPRPASFFRPVHLSFFIDKVIHSGYTSFPSGHTVTAFAIATVLSMHTAIKGLQILCLLLAIGVAYSRIFLSQHFLGDVLAGSLIGVSVATLFVYFSRTVSEEKLKFNRKKAA